MFSPVSAYRPGGSIRLPPFGMLGRFSLKCRVWRWIHHLIFSTHPPLPLSEFRPILGPDFEPFSEGGNRKWIKKLLQNTLEPPLHFLYDVLVTIENLIWSTVLPVGSRWAWRKVCHKLCFQKFSGLDFKFWFFSFLAFVPSFIYNFPITSLNITTLLFWVFSAGTQLNHLYLTKYQSPFYSPPHR